MTCSRQSVLVYRANVVFSFVSVFEGFVSWIAETSPCFLYSINHDVPELELHSAGTKKQQETRTVNMC